MCCLPRVIAPEEWATLSAGVVQRVKALEALLADLYGRGQIREDGILPRRRITPFRLSPSMYSIVKYFCPSASPRS